MIGGTARCPATRSLTRIRSRAPPSASATNHGHEYRLICWLLYKPDAAADPLHMTDWGPPIHQQITTTSPLINYIFGEVWNMWRLLFRYLPRPQFLSENFLYSKVLSTTVWGVKHKSQLLYVAILRKYGNGSSTKSGELLPPPNLDCVLLTDKIMEI